VVRQVDLEPGLVRLTDERSLLDLDELGLLEDLEAVPAG
jgi:hypothetical protein